MMKFSVAELLPHTGQMHLLERIIEYGENTLTSEVIVRSDGLFGDGKSVPAWLGIEYMAQTIASLENMKCRLAGKVINIGLLLGTRRYSCNVANFLVGSVLNVRVKELIKDQRLSVFDCQITGNGALISANVNVYVPDRGTSLSVGE